MLVRFRETMMLPSPDPTESAPAQLGLWDTVSIIIGIAKYSDRLQLNVLGSCVCKCNLET